MPGDGIVFCYVPSGHSSPLPRALNHIRGLYEVFLQNAFRKMKTDWNRGFWGVLKCAPQTVRILKYSVSLIEHYSASMLKVPTFSQPPSSSLLSLTSPTSSDTSLPCGSGNRSLFPFNGVSKSSLPHLSSHVRERPLLRTSASLPRPLAIQPQIGNATVENLPFALAARVWHPLCNPYLPAPSITPASPQHQRIHR